MCQPGLVILASLLKVSKSPGAGMPEGQSRYLLKLVSRILIETCHSSYKLHISQSLHLEKQCRKNGGVGYSFSPLQFSTVTNPHINLSFISMEVRGESKHFRKLEKFRTQFSSFVKNKILQTIH